MPSSDNTAGKTAGLIDQLEALLDYNRDMLKNAEAGEWDKVIGAEALRKTMLEVLYSASGVSNTPGIRRATNEMLSINQQLEQLAVSAQKMVTTDALSINKGRKAVSAYAKHER